MTSITSKNSFSNSAVAKFSLQQQQQLGKGANRSPKLNPAIISSSSPTRKMNKSHTKGKRQSRQHPTAPSSPPPERNELEDPFSIDLVGTGNEKHVPGILVLPPAVNPCSARKKAAIADKGSKKGKKCRSAAATAVTTKLNSSGENRQKAAPPLEPGSVTIMKRPQSAPILNLLAKECSAPNPAKDILEGKVLSGGEGENGEARAKKEKNNTNSKHERKKKNHQISPEQPRAREPASTKSKSRRSQSHRNDEELEKEGEKELSSSPTKQLPALADHDTDEDPCYEERSEKLASASPTKPSKNKTANLKRDTHKRFSMPPNPFASGTSSSTPTSTSSLKKVSKTKQTPTPSPASAPENPPGEKSSRKLTSFALDTLPEIPSTNNTPSHSARSGRRRSNTLVELGSSSGGNTSPFAEGTSPSKLYAGPTFHNSPAPSALPAPVFGGHSWSQAISALEMSLCPSGEPLSSAPPPLDSPTRMPRSASGLPVTFLSETPISLRSRTISMPSVAVNQSTPSTILEGEMFRMEVDEAKDKSEPHAENIALQRKSRELLSLLGSKHHSHHGPHALKSTSAFSPQKPNTSEPTHHSKHTPTSLSDITLTLRTLFKLEDQN
ncbi:uncharacterized protein VTP21DRAFT_4873 [Calcarisporiella thermophila]|uniref:uncharacterized protein n=1 Tax=Calcarisporiella thermophila TaxID=911321 RepID=UPI003743E80F